MYRIKNSKELAGYIELTNLNNMATEEEMKEFLEKAKEFPFHSVVVSPYYVSLANEYLKDTDIKIGTVVGFPLGFTTNTNKIAEAKEAIENGADEIDMVVNLSMIKEERYHEIAEDVKAMKEAIGDHVLKVIIEVKALKDIEKARVARAIENGGAEFVKTATGFVSPSTIYEMVNDINIIQKHAPTLKIKTSGGINKYKIANQILTAGADRIGSSSGYEIVSDYKNLRKNTQVKPEPIVFD